MTAAKHCRGTNADGAACRAPENLVGDLGLCPAHDPANRERLRQAARRGGKASARRSQSKKLTAEELGPLESVEDVRRWLERIGQAVASGRIDHKAGAGGLKAAEIATKILQPASREEIADLRTELQRLRSLKVLR